MIFTFALQSCTFSTEINVQDQNHVLQCANKICFAREHYENEGFINFLRVFRRKFYYRLAVTHATGSVIVTEVKCPRRNRVREVLVISTSSGIVERLSSLSEFFKILQFNPDRFLGDIFTGKEGPEDVMAPSDDSSAFESETDCPVTDL